MLAKHMQQLEKELELDEPFVAEPNGDYTYVLDDDLIIRISALRPEGLQLNAAIGSLPPEADEDFYVQMLDGNLLGQATYGASLGLLADGRQMSLSQVAARQVTYPDFRLLLDDFINVIFYWRQMAGLEPTEPNSDQ